MITVFARFKKWRERHRDKRIAWERAWGEASVRRPDGHTNFQHLVLDAIEPMVGRLTLSVTTGEVEQYLRGPLLGTDLTLYLYVDEVQAGGKNGFIAEKWDFDSPQEFADAFASFVHARLEPNTRLE
jgi:hypothetical protein